MIIEGLKNGIRVRLDELSIACDTEATEADAYIFSESGKHQKLSFSNPGEYELKNVFIYGMKINGNTGFSVRNRKWTFGYLPFQFKKLSGDSKNMLMELDAVFTIPEQIRNVREELSPRQIITRGEPAKIQKIAKTLDLTIANQSKANLKTVEANLINLQDE